MFRHFEEITPGTIHFASAEDIRKCGVSMRKALSIKGIATSVINGEMNLPELHELPDEEVVRQAPLIPERHRHLDRRDAPYILHRAPRCGKLDRLRYKPGNDEALRPGNINKGAF
jgi:hypothetical protein